MMSTKFTSWRGFATKLKPVPYFDQEVIKEIENKTLHPRRHPGRNHLPPCEVPDKFFDAIKNTIKEYSVKVLQADGIAVTRYLRDRRKPAEKKEIAEKTQMLQERTEEKYNIKAGAPLNPKKMKKATNEVLAALMRHTYVWAATDFSDYLCYPYLTSRSPAEYAILRTIFTEMSQREPQFQPESVFDFGSGVGTVIWASQSIWENSIKEYFCVDSSGKMNDIAKEIIGGGEMGGKSIISAAVYHRQFLPSSIQRKYNIVVSAFSLLELPDSKSRLETVSNLWAKTEDYLVLVEIGNKEGFEVINEARDYLLGLFSTKKKMRSEAHVFAPCPHDEKCPKLSVGDPCTFERSYIGLPLEGKKHIRRETYSYVVLKKGKRDSNDPQWPRIVEPVLVRHRHSFCRLCTAEGKFEEIVFTKNKHTKFPYWCARMSELGDRLPINTITKEQVEVRSRKSDLPKENLDKKESGDEPSDELERGAEEDENCRVILEQKQDVDISNVKNGESDNRNS